MQWFESWFDSPYYHILYQHRNDEEAELLIDNLYSVLKIQNNNTILDIACGAGRHSIYMAKKGNEVMGLDLSKNSIEEANIKAIQQNLTNKVKFAVEDMRNFDLNIKFDFVFNLFTSFGYFENKADNLNVIQSISHHQDQGGILVIDYLNSEFVRKKGEVNETKNVSNISFHIHKYIEHDTVIKKISFKDGGQNYRFEERVQLFHPTEIEEMLLKYNYKILSKYGDYHLNAFDLNSPRNIIIAIQGGL